VSARFRSLAALAAVTAVLLVACGDDGGETVLVENEEIRVLAIDNTFDPEDAVVAAGTTVRWVNNGRNDHNVLSADGAEWDVPTEDFVPGDEAEYRFTEPGEYRYYCSIHGTIDVGMIGTLTVE
jgi:plastocyanin